MFHYLCYYLCLHCLVKIKISTHADVKSILENHYFILITELLLLPKNLFSDLKIVFMGRELEILENRSYSFFGHLVSTYCSISGLF